MARLELVVKQLGKEPIVVPLTRTMLIGRSRKADFTVEDEEVGREQFRVEIESGSAFVEAVGRTNQTAVDGYVLPAGTRRPIEIGAVIQAGRTTFLLRSSDAANSPGSPVEPDVTMVARPAGMPPRAPTPAPAPQGAAGSPPRAPTPQPAAKEPEPTIDQTMQLKGPAYRPGAAKPAPAPAPASAPPPAPAPAEFDQTMQLKGPAYRPGAAKPAEPAPPPAAAEEFDQTMQLKGPARPGAAKPAPPPAPAPAPPPPAELDQTMQLKGPARPGAAKPAPPAAPAPAPAASPAPAELDQTMQLKGPAYRPGAAKPAPPPAPAPAASPAPAPAAAPWPAPAPTPQAPVDSPAPATAASPKTPGATDTTTCAPPVDFEPLLLAAVPRLVLKGEGLKRRFRLMQAKTSLGRAQTADLCLPVESVSELHAEISFDGVQFKLRDLGSTNGSFVDGAQLRGGAAALGRHSLIALGKVRALFLCNDPHAPTADLRLEERAAKLLVRDGRLPPDACSEAIRIARADTSQSIAEILLMDTQLLPAEWAGAAAAARRPPNALLALLARLWPFGRGAAAKA